MRPDSQPGASAVPRGERGRLYLVPSPLDHGCAGQVPLPQVLPQGTIAVAAALPHWISENARSTRAFLKRVQAVAPLARPLQEIAIAELPRAVHKKGDHGAGGATLADVVNAYDAKDKLGLSSAQKADLTEYLKSL